MPALLLVGVLAIGLGYIVEYSLHELDIATYRLKEAYSLANYQTFVERPVYAAVLWRSLLGAARSSRRSRSSWPFPTPTP